jgi:hypothetical protein
MKIAPYGTGSKPGEEASRLDRWMNAVNPAMKISPLPYDLSDKKALEFVSKMFAEASKMVRNPGDPGWVLKAQAKVKEMCENPDKYRNRGNWEGFQVK